MHRHFFTIGCGMKEHRLCRFAGGLDAVPEVRNYENLDYKSWKAQTDGADHLLNSFEGSTKLGIPDLKNYLSTLDSIQRKQIQVEMIAAFMKYENPTATPVERSRAEVKLLKLCDYIVSRNTLVKNARTDLRNLQTSTPELPPTIEKVKDGVTGVLGACIDGFSEASGKEKLVMLAGVAAAYLVLRNILHGASSSMPNATKFAKNTLNLALGATVGYIGLQAINKAVEKTSGRPLIDHKLLGGIKGGYLPAFPLRSSQEQWDKQRYDAVIEDAARNLRTGPRDVLDKIFVKQNLTTPQAALSSGITNAEYERRHRGNMAGIMNVSTLDVPSFQKLYEASRANQEIQIDQESYPRRPFKKDDLTAAERFLLLKQVGETVHLIDSAGNIIPQDPTRQDKTLLYLMLDI